MAEYLIREIHVDDAEAMIAFMKTIADEPRNMIITSSAAEFLWTPEQERELLKTTTEADNSTWLIAVTEDGQLIGSVNALGGKRLGTRGTATIGIAVAKDWRDRGVGTALMRALIDWARANPVVHRLELEVFTINERAVHIYEKLGFVREGVRREAVYKDGEYLDNIVMAILFPSPDDDAAQSR